MLFSLWVTAAAGYAAVYQALIMVLIGLPIYAFLKARREREGLAMEPVEYNPDIPHAEMIHHEVRRHDPRRSGWARGSHPERRRVPASCH